MSSNLDPVVAVASIDSIVPLEPVVPDEPFEPVEPVEPPAAPVLLDAPLALVDQVADAVRLCPAVAGLHGGRYARTTTYLPGRRVVGVTVSPDEIAVGVIGRYPAGVDQIAAQVRAAIGVIAPGIPVTVHLEDLALPGDPVERAPTERAPTERAPTAAAPPAPTPVPGPPVGSAEPCVPDPAGPGLPAPTPGAPPLAHPIPTRPPLATPLAPRGKELSS